MASERSARAWTNAEAQTVPEDSPGNFSSQLHSIPSQVVYAHRVCVDSVLPTRYTPSPPTFCLAGVHMDKAREFRLLSKDWWPSMSSDSHASHTPINRQAVVIIHGIGEQRPLTTLKNFVRSFRPGGTFYSKPERLTTSFEARRMKLRKLQTHEEGENWIETDFYEYYWTHMMFGTRWRHFMFWTGHVLARAWRAAGTGESTGRSLHNTRVLSARKWMVVLLGTFISVSVVLLATFGPLAVASVAVVLVGLMILLDWISDSVLLRVVGDVSRYLDVAPRNIARRHAILQGGIELLQSLHAERSDLATGEQGNAPYVYDRVVVVGHSLGSVIGYELIKHYWARVNRYLEVTEDAVKDIEETPESQSPDATADYHRLQFELWRKLGRSHDTDSQQRPRALAPPRWLVTDFVTLGSPLTYGAILLAESAAEFCEKTSLRELPTCPPNRSATDRPGGFAVHLWHEAAGHEKDPTLILHHAAPFSLTRWTNFFYEADPIGGRLSNIFGNGIRDIAVDPTRLPCGPDGHRRGSNGLKLHVQYWPPFPTCIPELIDILHSLPTDASRRAREQPDCKQNSR